MKKICVLVLLCWSTLLKADTKMSPEGVAIRAIVYAARDFQLLHPGLVASNWSQLSETRNIEGINNGTYPVKEHYVFLNDVRIPLTDAEKGNAFLIRISPVTNDISGEVGRYIVSRNGNEFIFNWLSETNVQKMLADAGVTELPKPEPLNQITNATGAVPVRDLSLTPTTNSARIVPQVEPAAVEPASASQGAEPASSAVAQTSPASPAPSAGSASFLKMFVVMLVAVLTVVAGWFLLRPRKQG